MNTCVYYIHLLVSSVPLYHRLRAESLPDSPDTLRKNYKQNPSQIFCNISGESDYDSKPVICDILIGTVPFYR